MTNFEKVGLFMKTFGQEIKIKASLSTEKINELRISLINEELEEFKEAIKNNDPIKLSLYQEAELDIFLEEFRSRNNDTDDLETYINKIIFNILLDCLKYFGPFITFPDSL